MLSPNSSPIAWLNRPYIDLEPANEGPLYLYDIEMSYRHLIGETSVPKGLQRIFPTSFRESLLRETGLSQYQVNNPLQLAHELRTERWNKLCDYLIHYQELSSLTKLRVINVLKSLCLHRAVLDYVPKITASEIVSDSVLAELAFYRSISSLILCLESGTLYNLDEFELIAHNAPSGSVTRIAAALQLVAHYAKVFQDLAQAEFWREFATQEIEKVKSSLDDFAGGLLMSIYYRAIALVSLIQGNKERVIEEMDRCEFYGESLTGENKWQQIAADENRNVNLKVRIKEALWLRQLDLAEERSRELVQRDPLDSNYYLELGEVLIKQDNIEEALKAYRSAIRLGPPKTAIAWFMAGQCYQALGELEMACDCYLSTIDVDPLAICAVERLTNLAPHLENSALGNWSQLRLRELQKLKQQMSMKQEPSLMREIAAGKTSFRLKKAPKPMTLETA